MQEITRISYSKTVSTVPGKNETYTIEAAVEPGADIPAAFGELKKLLEPVGVGKISTSLAGKEL